VCGSSGIVDKLKEQRSSAHTREGFRANARPRRGNPGGLLDPGQNLAMNVTAAGGRGEDFAVETNREAATAAAAEAATAAAADFSRRGSTALADRERRRRLRRSSLLASGGMGDTTLGSGLPTATPTLGA